jgi:hypothetical protein
MRMCRSDNKLQYQALGAFTDVNALAPKNNLANRFQNKLETSDPYRKENRRRRQR